jgi:hypothetical protein
MIQVGVTRINALWCVRRTEKVASPRITKGCLPHTSFRHAKPTSLVVQCPRQRRLAKRHENRLRALALPRYRAGRRPSAGRRAPLAGVLKVTPVGLCGDALAPPWRGNSQSRIFMQRLRALWISNALESGTGGFGRGIRRTYPVSRIWTSENFDSRHFGE